MTDYQPTSRRPIADVFRQMAHGAVRFCVERGIHPDAVSYASVVAAAVAAACFWQASEWPILILPAVLCCYLRLWFNMLDGMVALASGKASPRGEILNDLPDRISDVIIFVGVGHSGLCQVLGGYWVAILALLTAYVGTFGQAVGVQREFSGVMAKPWRMVVLSIGAIVTFVLVESGRRIEYAGLTVLDWSNLVIVIGCVQTIAVRLQRIMRALRLKQPAAKPAGSTGGVDCMNPACSTMPSATMSSSTAAYSATIASPVAPIQASEQTFALPDGSELFYRAWLPTQPADKALVLFHRGHEHSGRLADVVEQLKLDNVACFAWDARGHGRSPGERGYAPSFGCLVQDMDCFVRHLSEQHQIPCENMVVLAHSVGAVIATAWIHDFAPRIRALILVTPALRVKLYVPLAIPGLRLLAWLKRGQKTFIKSYVKAKMLTHDAEQAARYESDPLIARAIAVNILLGLHDAATRLMADAGAIRVPTLLLAGNADWVVKLSAEDRFFNELGSAIKKMRVFDGMYHDILHERDRQPVLDEIRQFVQRAFSEKPDLPALIDADQQGFTEREYARLKRPLPLGSPKNWSFAVQRLIVQVAGRLSKGIQIGWQTGFDSGQSLDYVYENRPQGSWGIGKWVDWIYLNSVGWRGIRQRKVHLQQLLSQAIRCVHADGQPVRVLDIATGCGRYVLDTIRSLPTIPVTALLRDFTPANLEAGRRLAAEMGLTGVEFAEGDAFDRSSLAAVQPAPNVAIVSGLYELFPENGKVLNSLRGVADAVAPGGYLIYTGQPWHPQLEMIARVLINRDGQPWIMRRRTQEELDDLVRAAGFEKIAMQIDEDGIFTVSLARRKSG